ncbi:MAG: hypothetical protein KatS3mg091_482 [Patescibacteria group bacterium]|nr:MAG: hypothetical protein KatS3mg091_482 [Patescibacteria group bacterium]
MKKNNNLIALVYFLMFGFLIYFPALFFDFTFFDDQELILNNLNFLTKPQNIIKAFQTDVFFSVSNPSYYRPLLTISFMLDALLAKDSPFMYHFSNLIFHILAVFLIYNLLRKLKLSEPFSLKLSLLFLAHPIVTPAVAWIPGRNDSLLAVFTLSALLFYLKYLKDSYAKNFLLYLLFLTLALFTKETAVMIVVVCLYFVIINKPTPADLVKLILSFSAVLAGYIIIRQQVLNNVIYLTLKELLNSVLTNFSALFYYFEKFFLPINLTVFPTRENFNHSLALAGFFAFLAVTVITKQKNSKLYFLGLIWFFSFNALNLIKLPQTTAEVLTHRSYTATIGLLIMLSSLNSVKRLAENKGIFTGFIAIFAVTAFFYQFSFSDRLTFWSKAVKAAPNSAFVHKNYGVMLYFKQDYANAIKHYNQALKLNPKEEMVHNNIGVIYLEEKKYQKAKLEFEKELQNNPNYDKALFNLGLAYYYLKEYNKAEGYWLKTLQINPRHQQAYLKLSEYYNKINETEKANTYFNLLQQLNSR